MDLFPIGSIVLLKNGKKRLMIYGRKQIDSTKGKIYDYVGCLYPEGNINSKYTFLFNHGDIEKVYFVGYTDAEEEEFSKKLKELTGDVKKDIELVKEKKISFKHDEKIKKEDVLNNILKDVKSKKDEELEEKTEIKTEANRNLLNFNIEDLFDKKPQEIEPKSIKKEEKNNYKAKLNFDILDEVIKNKEN